MYPKYDGKKWRVDGTKTITNPDVWAKDTYIEVPNFVMNRGYLKYLRQKREAEAADRVRCLREKLEYQQRTYGEVDPIDVSELMAAIQEYQAVCVG